jgi:hypothetical protein
VRTLDRDLAELNVTLEERTASIQRLEDELVQARATITDLRSQEEERTVRVQRLTQELVQARATITDSQTTEGERTARHARRLLMARPRLLIRLLATRLPGRKLVLHIDEPALDTTCSHVLKIRGWTFSAAAPVTLVEAYLDDSPLGRLEHGLQRPDVARALGRPIAAAGGYGGTVSLRGVRPGRHVVKVRATDGKNNVGEETCSICIAQEGVGAYGQT